MAKEIIGIVEAIGTKFNGSLKVNGNWFAFKKGVVSSAKVGDTVKLLLSPWSFNGKSGENITEITICSTQKKEEVAEQDLNRAITDINPPKARDYDAENRGKVRHGLLVPLMPLIATGTVDKEEVLELVKELTKFVMEG